MIPLRVMQWKVAEKGYMTPGVLKEESSDNREVVMVYSPTGARRKMTNRCGLQDELRNVFKLKDIERRLALH